MILESTNQNCPAVDLKTAVLRSLAPDGGLYLPTKIPKLPQEFFTNIQHLSFQEIATTVAQTLLGDSLPKAEIKRITEETLSFSCPLVKLSDNLFTLELFHGPTLAFKDFGARFMSRLVRYFAEQNQQKTTILVATSGDTGSAVAHGFLGVQNTEVILLYPKGKVSPLQEKQLTTMGQNITALEINGVFDDCQAMVKQAFNDPELNQKYQLTSANSINIARLIPQSFYYFWAYAQLKKHSNKPPVISVPSGNFGNITAGLIAKEMGLPIHQLIASVNQNDTFPRYQQTQKYQPLPSKHTISNAMDVGDPSNFARLKYLNLTTQIWSKSFSDSETEQAMQEIKHNHHYTADPHGAVGYLGLKAYKQQQPHNHPQIFLETAHPAKFLEVVEETLNTKIEIPSALKNLKDKTSQAIHLENDYNKFKDFLINR